MSWVLVWSGLVWAGRWAGLGWAGLVWLLGWLLGWSGQGCAGLVCARQGRAGAGLAWPGNQNKPFQLPRSQRHCLGLHVTVNTQSTLSQHSVNTTVNTTVNTADVL